LLLAEGDNYAHGGKSLLCVACTLSVFFHALRETLFDDPLH
jgi:hypothetical protein